MPDYRMQARLKDFAQRLRVHVSGRGGFLVLANGLGSDQGIWSRLLPWLEARFRVVRFDWPLEPHLFDAERLSRLEGFAEDLLAVIEAAEASPCVFVGHSLGCMAAILAAQDRPDAFRHLALLAPSPRYVDDGPYRGGLTPEEAGDILERMSEDFVRWAEHFSPIAVGLPSSRPEVQEFTRGVLAMRPDVAVSLTRIILHWDLRSRLDGLRVPVTIIQPRHDCIVPVEVGYYLHARWPGSRLEIIEASGHLPHLTAPHEVLRVLESAIGPLAGPQPSPSVESAGTTTTKLLPRQGCEYKSSP